MLKLDHCNLSLAQAEYWRNVGLMSAEEFATYFHYWSQAPRFGSDFCRCDKCKQTFPHRFLPENS
jgi:hypothetical protein